MAEKMPSKPSETKKRESNVIPLREYKRRELLKTIGKGALAVVADKTVQTMAGVGAVGAAAKLAHDNLVITENQSEKMAKYPPKELFIGTVTFKVGDSMQLRTEPIKMDQNENVISSVEKMGGKEVRPGDTVTIDNPLGLYTETKSGIRATWFQVPDTERRNLGVRNVVLGYAHLNEGNSASGRFYEILGIKDGFYQLQNHDPLPVSQTQVFKVNGK